MLRFPSMRWVKWLLAGLLILQLPFVYRLCQTGSAGRFISDLKPETLDSPFLDLRGGIHVHSLQGGHSLGLYSDILGAARLAGYDFVFITEHPRPTEVLQRPEDPEILIIYGYERELRPGVRVLEDESGRFRFLSHFDGDEVPAEVAGLEIYNLHENGMRGDGWLTRIHFLYHRLFYPDLVAFNIWSLDRRRLALWDRVQKLRNLSGIAGNDAHRNLGVILQTASGRVLASFLVDPYTLSFRFVTTHVQLPAGSEVTEDLVLEALARGSAFVAFEQVADPTGFAFYGQSGDRIIPMGSRIKSGPDLVFQAPLPSRFRLLRDGETYRELEGFRFVHEKAEMGVYRLEVYPLNPPRLLAGKPWILSNAIVVE